jgi:hypothetical protein
VIFASDSFAKIFTGNATKSAPPNGVHVDVLDHSHQSLRFDDITIVTATGLPKQAFDFIAASSSDAWQPLGSFVFQEFDRTAGHGTLDGFADIGDIVNGLPGVNNQMHVFRHEDIGPKIETQSRTSLSNCFGEPHASSFGLKKLKTPVAGECQFVRVAWLIDIAPVQSFHGSSHTSMLRNQ